MGIGDFVEKAKDVIGDHPDEAEGLLDTVAGAVKDRTPDAVDAKIDMAVEKAKDVIEQQKH